MSERTSPKPSRFDPLATRALVFDLDGTLVDSYSAIGISLNHARAGFDLPPLKLDEIRHRVGRGLESLIAETCGTERVEEGVRRFRSRYAEVWPSHTLALPGAARTIRELGQRGFRLALASNKPSTFSHSILERLGMRDWFKLVTGPDRVGSAKPDPAMLESCLAVLQVAPIAAVYIGDMVLDVETAARAGTAVALVPGGSSPVDELKNTGERVLGSIEELLTLLSKPGGCGD